MRKLLSRTEAAQKCVCALERIKGCNLVKVKTKQKH